MIFIFIFQLASHNVFFYVRRHINKYQFQSYKTWNFKGEK